MKTFLSPSILSADFTNISEAVFVIEQGGADWVHCDVMDGVFVPNISFGQKMVADIKRITKLTVDTHLMIIHPIRYVDEFAKNSDLVTFHIEAAEDPLAVIQKIKKHGKKVGISIKPATGVEAVLPYLGLIEVVLVMSVEPGFGGQKFIPASFEKIEEIRKFSSEVIIEVDGGVNLENTAEIIKRGANAVVVGNAVFSCPDRIAKTNEFKNLIRAAQK